MTKQQRKTIEIASKRIPLRQLINGKEIREAAKALEDFRMKLNEQEFLYGAKITVKWDNYGDVYAVARRQETDKEYQDRLEKARIAAEQRAARERKRQEQARIRAEQELATRKQRAADAIQKLAKEAGILVDISGV